MANWIDNIGRNKKTCLNLGNMERGEEWFRIDILCEKVKHVQIGISEEKTLNNDIEIPKTLSLTTQYMNNHHKT